MTSFDHYDTGGVYGLRIPGTEDFVIVVTSTHDTHISGYASELKQGDELTTIAVADDRMKVRHEPVAAKQYYGAFRTVADRYVFPEGGPTSLILDVPEDKRDSVTVDGEDGFDYYPVACECGDWEGDYRRTIAGNRCPKCGADIPEPDGWSG